MNPGNPKRCCERCRVHDKCAVEIKRCTSARSCDECIECPDFQAPYYFKRMSQLIERARA
jgi:hypothetical protein